MKPRWVWTGIAAAVVLVAAGVVVVPRLGLSPTPAPPTDLPVVTRTASPTATPTPPPMQTLAWVRRAPSPMKDPSEFSQASAAGNDYFLKGPRGCGQLVGYRHDPARDVWHSLRPTPGHRYCTSFSLFSHGSDLYVLTFPDPPATRMTTSIYHTASDTWTILAPVALDPCVTMVLATGILCSRAGEESLPLRYSFFDYRTERWREGSVDLGVANTGEWVQPVTVAGRSLGLSTVWPSDFTLGGAMTLATFDPVTGKAVSSTSKEVSPEALRGSSGKLQVAAPGYVFLGPDSPYSSGTTGDLVDLTTGEWTTLHLPVQGTDRRSQADWVFDFYGAEASTYVQANGYLFEPSTQRWLAVPWDGVAPPARDIESDEDIMVRAGPQEQCTWTRSRGCWALDVGSLESISRQLDPSELPPR